MKAFMCFAALAFLCVFYGLAVYNTPKTDAAVQATDFVAGRIIDDEIFYDANTMSVEEIQAFLDEKLPNCDMWGTGSSTGRVVSETGYVMPAGSTNADYARLRAAAGNSRYHEPPYVCVNKYYENPETHETLYETNGIVKDGMISAAQIIYNEARKYSINPQVLLVLLKKESYVWGDTWPLKWEYNSAMGYGCPDNAPCDTAYYGFYNQVHMAAYQFDRYKQKNYEYNYHLGMVNNIYYSPTYSCGTKQVYIENMATASLYIYTPYTPNDAALQNYPGTSYCGSYGNRNFFMYFSEWFGSTYAKEYKEMIQARSMTIAQDTLPINPMTGELYEEWENIGETYFYNHKIEIMWNDIVSTCLVTEEDYRDGIDRCTLMKRLGEYNPNKYEQEKAEVYLSRQYTCSVDPQYRTVMCDDSLNAGEYVISMTQLRIGEMQYIYDSTRERYYIMDRFDVVNKTDVQQEMLYPRDVLVKENTESVSLFSNGVCEKVDKGYKKVYFSKKTEYNGMTYLVYDEFNNDLCVVPLDLTEEIDGKYDTFKAPRYLVAKNDITQASIAENEECSTIKKGDKLFFDTKMKIGDINYYRSSDARESNSTCMVDSRELSEIE